jgi:chorismate synthase
MIREYLSRINKICIGVSQNMQDLKMLGCHIECCFQATIDSGSYQDGLTAVVQGHPPGMLITKQDIYDLLLRKLRADELSSPGIEPDLPTIFSGVDTADTIEGANNAKRTNGTPLTILIPHPDRHFIHIKQYQDTNRPPRYGHCSYASFIKYGATDDAIGAGFFSGRYTAAIVAAGPESGAGLVKRIEKEGEGVFYAWNDHADT